MDILRVGSITAGGNIILVTTDSGATVYAVSGGKVVSGVAVGGVAKLKVKAGTWRVWAEKDGQQTSEVEVIVTDSYYKEMSFGLPLSSLAEGALIQLNENGSGVNFYLAKHNYESGLNGNGRHLLVRKDLYANSYWHASNVNAYATSGIDAWLTVDYVNRVSDKVRNAMGTTKFYYTPGNGNIAVATLERAAFSLSLTELGQSHQSANTEGSALPIAETLKIALLNGTASPQWTRTPSIASNGAAWVVNASGAAMVYLCTSSYGIRPCFTLPATALCNPTPNADGSYTLMV